MPDRYPKDSVLVPQRKRVEDGLPEDGLWVSLVVRTLQGVRIIVNGCHNPGIRRPGFWVPSYDGMDLVRPNGTVTHWSPRVGIPLPEEE